MPVEDGEADHLDRMRLWGLEGREMEGEKCVDTVWEGGG